ncbi:uncharacterized protein LOC127277439 [Leptopilina boulardi]|uniref:uncharacterized protein LOC127277439 n=1 Tax=Leptopilina boulardi TaxID=63433 RepID=UPI0021F6598A|nr:uncharacterized protein LOC127277439 [Leptopilina boulardi]
MNLINIKFILLILFIFSSCNSYERELFLKRSLRQISLSNDSVIKKNCSLIFDSFFERDETIKRGYYLSRLRIEGTTIRISDIPEANYCQNEIAAIELFATEKIIFDQDYNSHGVSVSLVAAAPTWIVNGNERKIILTGKNGKKPHSKKRQKKNSKHGADGKEGAQGGDGGYFYGSAKYFLWQSDDNGTIINEDLNKFPLCTMDTNEYLLYTLCNSSRNFVIKFYVNGGKGGKGQDGGDGLNGLDGTTFNFDKKLIASDGTVKDYETILKKIIEPPFNEQNLGMGISELILGDRPTLGGRGGNAGAGGYGGKGGGVFLISLTETPCYLTTEYPMEFHRGKYGKNGKNGQPGFRGLAGSLGYDIRLNLYTKKNGEIEIRNVEHFRHESPYLKRKVNNGIVLEQSYPKFIPSIYGYGNALNNYIIFLNNTLNNTRNEKMHKEILDIFNNCHIRTCIGCP